MAKKKLHRPESVVLTEENKEEVSESLGYSIEVLDHFLAQAAEKGFKGVKLPILKR